MNRKCVKCNSDLLDTQVTLCTRCEEARRLEKEALFARKRKAFNSAMTSSLSEFEVDAADVIESTSEKAEYGRCTICFKEFYGEGAHCAACTQKLDLTADEWDDALAKRRAKRDALIIKAMVGISIILVLVGVLLSVRNHHRLSKPALSPVAAAGSQSLPEKNNSSNSAPPTTTDAPTDNPE